MGRAAATKPQAAEEVTASQMPLRLEWRTPAELAENPKNWRTHPAAQVEALEEVLGDVGWAGVCLYNERTKRLIDGHARRNVRPDLLVDGKLPVLIGSWTEEQEAKILATLDPLAAMAAADSGQLAGLLEGVSIQSAALHNLLAEMMHAAAGGSSSAGDPADAAAAGPEKMALMPYEHYDYLLVLATNKPDFQFLIEWLGIGQVVAPTSKSKVGLGRAVLASKLIEKLKHGHGDHRAQPGPAGELPPS